MTADCGTALRGAARVVSAHQHADALGHVCIRTSSTELRITPPKPLGHLAARDQLPELRLGMTRLPEDGPLEAWIHPSPDERAQLCTLSANVTAPATIDDAPATGK
jgi:hypothetical protein